MVCKFSWFSCTQKSILPWMHILSTAQMQRRTRLNMPIASALKSLIKEVWHSFRSQVFVVQDTRWILVSLVIGLLV